MVVVVSILDELIEEFAFTSLRELMVVLNGSIFSQYIPYLVEGVNGCI